jgi:hypothetical protein
LLLDLLESYTRIQDDLTELRVEFVTKLLVHHIIKVLGLQEAFFYAQLLQKLTIIHPCASAVLLELRHEWLIKFYFSIDEQMRTIAEEIMTDLLWLQADKQSVSLLTETCLSVFKMPLDNVCMMDLNSVCTAIEFLSLQLEDKKTAYQCASVVHESNVRVQQEEAARRQEQHCNADFLEDIDDERRARQ